MCKIYAYVISCKTIATTQKHFKTFNLARKVCPDTQTLPDASKCTLCE